MRGRALQQSAHRQAFSTAPVDDLLEQIAEALPAIRRDAGVTALVSIWDAAGLARHAGAERVDVTAALVDAFQPTARQTNWLIALQSCLRRLIRWGMRSR